MIHIPQDWRDKALHGLNIFSHIEQLYRQRTRIAPALQIWLGAVVVSSLMYMAGVWHLLAQQLESLMPTVFPHMVVFVQPTTLSNQFVYVCIWIAVPFVARAILTGAGRATKSWGWYFLHFLLASLWIGVAAGLALSIGSFAVGFGGSISFSVSQNQLFTRIVYPVLGVLILWLITLYLTRAALTGLTFGAALLLQGKGFVDAYVRGSRLFNNHWPYVIGVMWYFFVVHAFIQLYVLPVFSNNSLWTITLGSLRYALWPLYWGIILPYYKRAVRRR